MTRYSKNILKQKLKNGERVFGTWTIIPDTTSLNVIASSGLDFIIIDMEHGSMDFKELPDFVRAIESGGSQVIVRLPNKKSDTILKVLETGVKSILVPHVSSVEEAEDIVKNCKYYPDGNRGLSPYTINHNYSDKEVDLKRSNEEILVGVMLEGKNCVRLSLDISKVIGIDLIYTGIYDISQSLGIPGDLYNEKVIKMQKLCVENITKNGKSAGSFCKDLNYTDILKDSGYQFLSYLVDCIVLKEAYEKAKNSITYNELSN